MLDHELTELHSTRMKEVSLHAALYQLIARPTGKADLLLDTYEQKVEYVFFVMEALLNETLTNGTGGGLTSQEVAALIKEKYAQDYHKDLLASQAQSLANWILTKVLKNDTLPIHFEPDAAQSGDWGRKDIRFVEFPQVERSHGREIVWQLGEDGIRLMFSYKEVSENMEISYSGLIVKEQTSRGDYDGALQGLREQIQRLQMQQTRISRMIDNMRSNVLSVSIQDNRDVFRELMDAIDRAKEYYEATAAVVDERSEALNRSRHQDGLLDAATENRIAKLEDLRAKISATLGEILKTHNLYQGYVKARREAQTRQLSISTLRSHTVRKDILDPLLKGTLPPGAMAAVVAPMFRKDAGKLFTIDRLLDFSYQADTIEEDEDLRGIDEEAEARKEKERQRVQARIELQQSLTLSLLFALKERPDHTICLSEFAAQSDLLQQGQEVNTIKELLVHWLDARPIDLRELNQVEEDGAEKGLPSFDLKKTVIMAMHQSSFRDFSWLRTQTLAGREVRIPVDSMMDILVPDVRFVLEQDWDF